MVLEARNFSMLSLCILSQTSIVPFTNFNGPRVPKFSGLEFRASRTNEVFESMLKYAKETFVSRSTQQSLIICEEHHIHSENNLKQRSPQNVPRLPLGPGISSRYP